MHVLQPQKYDESSFSRKVQVQCIIMSAVLGADSKQYQVVFCLDIVLQFDTSNAISEDISEE